MSFFPLLLSTILLGHKTVKTEKSIWVAITHPKAQKNDGIRAAADQNILSNEAELQPARGIDSDPGIRLPARR
jgi:hypothetical protein